jgi:hypothetical protein
LNLKQKEQLSRSKFAKRIPWSQTQFQKSLRWLWKQIELFPWILWCACAFFLSTVEAEAAGPTDLFWNWLGSLKLVGTSNFKVINVIKKGQNYYKAQFSPKNFFFLQKIVETNPNPPHMFHLAWSTAKKASKKKEPSNFGRG